MGCFRLHARLGCTRWEAVCCRSHFGTLAGRLCAVVLKKAMIMEVNGQRKRGRPKMMWKRQMEESVKKVGLKIEEAADRTRCREGVRAIAEGMRCIRPPSVTRKKPN